MEITIAQMTELYAEGSLSELVFVEGDYWIIGYLSEEGLASSKLRASINQRLEKGMIKSPSEFKVMVKVLT